MILQVLHLSVLLIDHFLFVISLLLKILVQHSHLPTGQVTWLILSSFGQLVDHLVIPVLELARVLNLSVEIADDFFLDIVRHSKITGIRNSGRRIQNHIDEGRHASSHSRPQVLGLALRLRQLRGADLRRGVLVVLQASRKLIYLCLHLAEEALGVGQLTVFIGDCGLHGLAQGEVGHKWFLVLD